MIGLPIATSPLLFRKGTDIIYISKLDRQKLLASIDAL